MYSAKTIFVQRSDPLFAWCDDIAHKANNLYNAALFRERQMMFAAKRTNIFDLSDNELEVMSEFEWMNYYLPKDKQKILPPSGSISYATLDCMMKLCKNPDYCCTGLPRQTAQQILKMTLRDICSFFAALKSYKRDPGKFTGRPKMPGYKHKKGACAFIVTNQDCVIRKNKKHRYTAKLPFTKQVVRLGREVHGKFVQLNVTPRNGTYKLSFVFDDGTNAPATADTAERIAAIDLGVDNLMAVTNNVGAECLLFKGGAAKSANHYFNQMSARIQSEQTSGSIDKFVPTKRYYRILQKRNNRINDCMLKDCKRLITWCVEKRIDTIVIGENKFWKQECSMGGTSNQNFVQIPFERLKRIITYSAERLGISIIYQEESYTSKASFLDRDKIPVYSRDSEEHHKFSGAREKRGLYRSADGTKINADLNGSANILRKAIPDAFESGIEPDFRNIRAYYHPDLKLA